MNTTTTFGQRLLKGTFWRSKKDGSLHVDRQAADDVEIKLLTGLVGEFGYLSAIREVIDVETGKNFIATKAAYLAVAGVVEFMGTALRETTASDTFFSDQYSVVAKLVTEHANTLQ